MSVARTFAVLLYVVAVVTASSAGLIVAFLVGVVGAACLALAYAASSGSAERSNEARVRPARRRRRA